MAPLGCGTTFRAETSAGARSLPSDPSAMKLAAASGEGRTLPREELGELGEPGDGGIPRNSCARPVSVRRCAPDGN